MPTAEERRAEFERRRAERQARVAGRETSRSSSPEERRAEFEARRAERQARIGGGRAPEAEKGGGGRSILGQLADTLYAAPAGLAHLAKSAAQTAASVPFPILPAYDAIRGKTPETGRSALERYAPLPVEMGESLGRTGKAIVELAQTTPQVGMHGVPVTAKPMSENPIRKASDESRLVPFVMEHAGNIALVAGAAGAGAGALGSRAATRAGVPRNLLRTRRVSKAARAEARRAFESDYVAPPRPGTAPAVHTMPSPKGMGPDDVQWNTGVRPETLEGAARRAERGVIEVDARGQAARVVDDEAAAGARQAANAERAKAASRFETAEALQRAATLGEYASGDPAALAGPLLRGAGAANRRVIGPLIARARATDAGGKVGDWVDDRRLYNEVALRLTDRFRTEVQHLTEPVVQAGVEAAAILPDEVAQRASYNLRAGTVAAIKPTIDEAAAWGQETLGVDAPTIRQELLTRVFRGDADAIAAYQLADDYIEGRVDPELKTAMDEAQQLLRAGQRGPRERRYLRGYGQSKRLSDDALKLRVEQTGTLPLSSEVDKRVAPFEERLDAQAEVVGSAAAKADRAAGRRVLTDEQYRAGADKQVGDVYRQARRTAFQVVQEAPEVAARVLRRPVDELVGDAPTVERLADQLIIGRRSRAQGAGELMDIAESFGYRPPDLGLRRLGTFRGVEAEAGHRAVADAAGQRADRLEAAGARLEGERAGAVDVLSGVRTELKTRIEEVAQGAARAANLSLEDVRIRRGAELGVPTPKLKRVVGEARRAARDLLDEQIDTLRYQVEATVADYVPIRIPDAGSHNWDAYVQLRDALGPNYVVVIGEKRLRLFTRAQDSRGGIDNLVESLEAGRSDTAGGEGRATALEEFIATLDTLRDLKRQREAPMSAGMDRHLADDPFTAALLEGDMDTAVSRLAEELEFLTRPLDDAEQAARVRAEYEDLVDFERSAGTEVDADVWREMLDELLDDETAAVSRLLDDPRAVLEAKLGIAEEVTVEAPPVPDPAVAPGLADLDRLSSAARRTGRVEGRQKALGAEGGRARAEQGRANGRTGDRYEARVGAATDMTAMPIRLARRAGEAQARAVDTAKVAEREQTKLNRAEDALHRARARALDDPNTAPARYSPAFTAAKEAGDAIRSFGKDLDQAFPGAEALFSVLAEDITSTLGKMNARGINPEHLIGGEAFAKKRRFGRMPAPLARGKTHSEKRRSRLADVTDMTVRGQTRLEVSGINKEVRNELSFEMADHYGKTAEEVLGAGGDMKPGDIVKAMEAENWVAWDPASPYQKVPDAQVRPDTVFIPAPAFEVLSKSLQGSSSMALRIYDKVNNAHRILWLPLSPAWLTNNVIGNALMGISEVGFDYFRALPEALALQRSGHTDLALTNRGFSAQQRDLLRDPTDVMPERGRVRSAANKVIETSFAWNEFADEVSRSAIAIAAKAQGASPQQAVRRALRAAGDFQRMTPIERTVVKRVWLFYPWYKHITKLAFSLPMNHPHRVMWTMHLGEVFGDPEDQAGLPAFLRGSIPLGGNRFIPMGGMNPFPTGANSALVDPQAAFRSLAPALQQPFAILTGRDLSKMGKEISRPPGSARRGLAGSELPNALFDDPKQMAWYLGQQFSQIRALTTTTPGRRLFGVDYPQGDVERYGTGEPLLIDGKPVDANTDTARSALSWLGVPYPMTVDVDELDAKKREKIEADRKARERYERRVARLGS